MKKVIWMIMVIGTSVLAGRTVSAQTFTPKVIAAFSGASLKWILAAEPEFKRRKLNLDNYKITVLEQEDSVAISLSSPDASEEAQGSGSVGKYPGFEVEIRKKDMKVLRSNYVR